VPGALQEDHACREYCPEKITPVFTPFIEIALEMLSRAVAFFSKEADILHPPDMVMRVYSWRTDMATQEKKIDAKDLNIDLSSHRESEYFKWFLACLLFGKPIQQEVAKRTYFEFVNEGLTTPAAILQAGWDKLVEVLDRGHYVRFDYSTATKLLDVSKALQDNYGTLTALFQQCATLDEVASRLQAFKGVGPKTTDIFLRDMAPVLSGNLPKKK
jgi:endonuclease III